MSTTPLDRDWLARQQSSWDHLITLEFLIIKKISSGFSNMTADEWKNWTVLYSLIALHIIIPPDHLACWELFNYYSK